MQSTLKKQLHSVEWKMHSVGCTLHYGSLVLATRHIFSSKIASKMGEKVAILRRFFLEWNPIPNVYRSCRPTPSHATCLPDTHKLHLSCAGHCTHVVTQHTHLSKNLGLFSCSKIFFFCTPCFVSSAFCISNKLAGRSTLGFPPAVSEHI